MVGGGDFEDPDWTDIWSSIWLGSGVPVRTDDPDFVVQQLLDVAGRHAQRRRAVLSGTVSRHDRQHLASGLAFAVRIVDQDVGADDLCVALLDASGNFIGPYAPDNWCIDLDGDWTYALTFSAADRTSLAGQTAYLAVFTAGDGVEPHMSAFVDDISPAIDFPSPAATITPHPARPARPSS